MKKIIFLFLLSSNSLLFSQTILNSYPLDLKKSYGAEQILTAENKQTHEVFVFAADSENISILKYNSSLFLTDQYKGPLKDVDDKSLVGYSFSADGLPTLYWSTKNYGTIIATKYFFGNKTSKNLNFVFTSEKQSIITQFQLENSYNLLVKDLEEQTLILYTFGNGTVEQKIFDFSAFKFQNSNTKFVTFNYVIQQNPIEQIGTDEYNPLFKTTAKSKLYIFPNRFVLTLDHNPKKTQVFDINLETEEIKEKDFTQSLILKPKKRSNSFFQDNKLYQTIASDEEFFLDIKDYNSDKTLKSFHITKNDTIDFKTSPLLIQREGEKAKALKTTKKFLNNLSYLDIGLSVFKNKENTLITLGGTPNMARQGSIFISSYYPFEDFGFYDNGSSYYPPNYSSGYIHTESVYFESVWNPDFAIVKQEQLEPLAIDNIYYFMSLNKQIALDNILKYKDFYILNYYDTASKQFIMRKFKDGFNADDPFLDQLNTPSSFKKPFHKRS
ncbi:hypothetical protein SAMN05444397_105281 [Flavobacterium aquidurense]|uniref:Uncharacterized protein n=1 Tax=Flavobacterium frigidimaris TaxID=262320 RepID=A0ABX4BWD5_FLAFR|nr:hypothetical protein [Flavobacterium frigidimaris]OXA81875.1 hypothetical protein B0A65_02255 [Flavobacterium frigidimaris]SDZ34138.1 hypothetical protein SAMN05444397_105281 [Flavobacterium aquidurense]